MHIAITGANGFLGKALVAATATNQEHVVAALVRRQSAHQHPGAKYTVIGDISPITNWLPSLLNVDVVIHTAARVHIIQDSMLDPLNEYRQANVVSALNLAHQAAQSGIKRFIYISSIKANGEHTSAGSPFFADSTPNPIDPYGVSKLEAEIGLYAIGRKTGMEIVCIRPPLVYGPGVKGNFLKMLRYLSQGVPLPIGAITNLRSFVACDNLVDLIITCCDHAAAANQTFLVSDDEDVSTKELFGRLGAALNKPARILSFPPTFLWWGARITGKKNLAHRLFGNLQIDILKTKNLLDWSPPVSMDKGLKLTADWFKSQQ